MADYNYFHYSAPQPQSKTENRKVSKNFSAIKQNYGSIIQQRQTSLEFQ